jgi:hypothetical protein
MTRSLFLLLFVTFFGINLRAQDGAVAPPGWRSIRVCSIGFFAPNELKKQDVGGGDSCNATYENGVLRLSIARGVFDGRQKKYDTSLKYTEESVEIDGRKAQLVTYASSSQYVSPSRKYIAVVYFDLSGSQDAAKTSLTLTVAAKGEKGIETAKQIFRTIKFQ